MDRTAWEIDSRSRVIFFSRRSELECGEMERGGGGHFSDVCKKTQAINNTAKFVWRHTTTLQNASHLRAQQSHHGLGGNDGQQKPTGFAGPPESLPNSIIGATQTTEACH